MSISGVIEQLNNHVKILKEYVGATHANLIIHDRVLQKQAFEKNELRKTKHHKQKVRLPSNTSATMTASTHSALARLAQNVT